MHDFYTFTTPYNKQRTTHIYTRTPQHITPHTYTHTYATVLIFFLQKTITKTIAKIVIKTLQKSLRKSLQKLFIQLLQQHITNTHTAIPFTTITQQHIFIQYNTIRYIATHYTISHVNFFSWVIKGIKKRINSRRSKFHRAFRLSKYRHPTTLVLGNRLQKSLAQGAIKTTTFETISTYQALHPYCLALR